MKAVLCFLSLVALVYSQGVPECLQASVGSVLAAGVKNAVLASPAAFKPTTKAGINAVMNQILAVLKANPSPFSGFTGVGFDNHDFYGVQPLDSGYFMFSVRNEAVYRDIKRHFFLGATPDVENAAEVRVTDYDPVLRPWYKQGSGWETYIFAAGFSGEGRYGSSAYNSFSGGVALADREFLEPCGPCLERSAATSMARATAASAVQPAANWQSTVKSLFNILKAAGNKYITGVYFGTSEGKFYMVTNCASSSLLNCKDGNLFEVEVTDGAVGTISKYALLDQGDGAFGSLLGSRSYDPRARPWYTLGNGWTTPYPFSGSSLIARTYAFEFNGGVVGIDKLDSEPCSSCAASPTCPTCPPSSGSGSCSGNGGININFGNLFNGFKP